MQKDGRTDEVGPASFHHTFVHGLSIFKKKTLWAPLTESLNWHAAPVRCSAQNTHAPHTQQNQSSCKGGLEQRRAYLAFTAKKKEREEKSESVDTRRHARVQGSEQQII